MKQVATIYLILIFAGVFSSQIDAKRGCSLYGHSCYGGHGKRSEMVEIFPRNELAASKSAHLQELMLSADDVQELEERPRFRLIKLIKNWIDEQNTRTREGSRPNEIINSDEMFKDTLGKTI